jgi:hypothetical protein
MAATHLARISHSWLSIPGCLSLAADAIRRIKRILYENQTKVGGCLSQGWCRSEWTAAVTADLPAL